MNIEDFTEEEIKDLHHMMQTTWDAIGYDMLQVIADSEGKRIERVVMKPDAVIEVVLDASYMEMDAVRRPADKELLKRFRQLSYDDQIAVARQTFTCSGGYGL